jgi:hypothetical protein
MKHSQLSINTTLLMLVSHVVANLQEVRVLAAHAHLQRGAREENVVEPRAEAVPYHPAALLRAKGEGRGGV